MHPRWVEHQMWLRGMLGDYEPTHFDAYFLAANPVQPQY